jgi:hypothetical protein
MKVPVGLHVINSIDLELGLKCSMVMEMFTRNC